ncbi:MAG TPA: hypothetical protein VEK08_00435 [Planctomycetota bacterium]|nr:hypothetical protein [Planctomycetota bacterium]
MGLISKFSDWLSGKTASATKSLAAFAKAEAEGKQFSEKDTEALHHALIDSNRTLEDFRAMVDVFRKADALKKQAGTQAEIDALAKQMWAKAAELAALHPEYMRLVQELCDRSNALQAEQRNLAYQIEQRENARRKLELLRFENAAIFGLEFTDLSRLTLTCMGSTLEGESGAETQEVPAAIFEQEVARRSELLDAEMKRRLSEWEKAWAKWKHNACSFISEEAYAKTVPPPSSTMPSYPTYADVLSRLKTA